MARAGIGFIPWFPLATGHLAESGGPLDEIATLARRHARLGGARLLARSEVMLPIPGTSSIEHFERTWPPWIRAERGRA